MNNSKIGVLGAGTMGEGIAQVAAQAGHRVVLVDVNEAALTKAQANFQSIFARLVEKGKMTNEKLVEVSNKISYSTSLDSFSNCRVVIEAIVENINAKHSVFKEIEKVANHKNMSVSKLIRTYIKEGMKRDGELSSKEEKDFNI